MTLSEAVDIRQVAARVALAVPGVAGLQPTLGHRLASVAVRVSQTVATAFRPPEAGIQAERRPRSSGWHVEVRCVLNGERRALDTARDVRRQVRSALTAHLAQHGTPEPITVLVTITRIMSQTS